MTDERVEYRVVFVVTKDNQQRLVEFTGQAIEPPATFTFSAENPISAKYIMANVGCEGTVETRRMTDWVRLEEEADDAESLR